MAKFSFLLAATVALAGFSVPAAAENEGERYTAVVRYDDLNLSSVDGRKRLATRVKVAVRKVCGTRLHNRQALRERAVANRCEDSAMADADVKLAGLFKGENASLADRGRIVVAAAP